MTYLSTAALREYGRRAKIGAAPGTPQFNELLRQQGLFEGKDGALKPTGFGLLLFGTKPRDAFQQAGVLAQIRYSGGGIETKDFDGPMVLLPEELERWLRAKLPNVIDRSSVTRRDVDAVPYELIREGVVNALVHRDYDIGGAKVQLVVTPDLVVIRSPGQPPSPVTVEQLQRFEAPMLSRNPLLHYVFAQMGYAEERGLGVLSMRNAAQALNLPAPRYRWDAPYLELTLFLQREAVTRALPAEVLDALTESERRGWLWLAERERATSAEYAAALATDARTARRHLNHFVELGLVRKAGAGPATAYEVA